MRASACIGRVGGLAFALGVWAVVAAGGPAVANAAPSGDSSASTGRRRRALRVGPVDEFCGGAVGPKSPRRSASAARSAPGERATVVRQRAVRSQIWGDPIWGVRIVRRGASSQCDREGE